MTLYWPRGEPVVCSDLGRPLCTTTSCKGIAIKVVAFVNNAEGKVQF
jgi:hypothetical protein